MAPREEGIIEADPYRGLLSRLQRAVRARDRSAVVRLVRLPLRVNFSSGVRVYRDARDVTRDFDRIFTPRVRRAVLSQKAATLAVGENGARLGNGEIWLSETAAGEVRVAAVNP
jgi:hypothetical protein